MSFRFNSDTFQDNSFNERMKEKLSNALNSKFNSSNSSEISPSMESNRGATSCSNNFDNSFFLKARDSKFDILKSGITVSKVDFPTIPHFEILDLDVYGQPSSLAKGFCKIACQDALLQIQTEIEANSLLQYSNSAPAFTTPHMICNDSFTIPITMTFSKIQLEAITNVFVKKTGISISFNDVSLDFHFDCSIKLLQPHIAKRLRNSMQKAFKDVLPSVIFNMSKNLFTHEDSSATNTSSSNSSLKLDSEPEAQSSTYKLTACELDLHELSPVNMLKLSTLVSSRQTLSLHSSAPNTFTTIPGCLNRQNFHRYNAKMPSLTNIYSRETSASIRNKNILPAAVLNSNKFDLDKVIAVQTKIYERSNVKNSKELEKPRRRKIFIKKSRQAHEQDVENDESRFSPATDSSVRSSSPSTPIDESSLIEIPEQTVSLKEEKINILTNPTYVTKPELHNIHASFNTPIADEIATNVTDKKLLESKVLPLIESGPINVVGLNHRPVKDWGYNINDKPPPYK